MPSTDDDSGSKFSINGRLIDFGGLRRHPDSTPYWTSIAINDEATGSHQLRLSVRSYEWSVTEPKDFPEPDSHYSQVSITVIVESIDGQAASQSNRTSVGFTISFKATATPELLDLTFLPDGEVIDMAEVMSAPKANMQDNERTVLESDKTIESSSQVDLAAEIEELQHLMSQAEKLDTLIKEKRKSIREHVSERQGSLEDAVKQCDGVVCAAKAVVQRICEKIKSVTSQRTSYASVAGSRQVMIAAVPKDDEEPQPSLRNCTVSSNTFRRRKGTTDRLGRVADLQACVSEKSSLHAEAMTTPLTLTHNASTTSLTPVDASITSNALTQAFAIIFALLGLLSVCRYIRRKCMSMRNRVERDADREERRNARAYRRAARRALWRKRYDHFISAFDCFHCHEEPATTDYEEKRALILQDAFLEQSQDQAEKGEIMEAEIRELRYAHEIVASLVRVDEHRFELVRDPPPGLTPLPYTPETRSRASTGSLPSYNSEPLPGYVSTPESVITDSGSVADGFTHYTPPPSDGERSHPRYDTSPPPSTGGRRYTPVSSVRDISPRCSSESLRTRQSRDTYDL